MNAYALTNFDMMFNEKYYKLSFRTDTTFDELNAALEKFKEEIAEFKVKSDEEIAKRKAEALENVEAAVEVLDPVVEDAAA